MYYFYNLLSHFNGSSYILNKNSREIVSPLNSKYSININSK